MKRMTMSSRALQTIGMGVAAALLLPLAAHAEQAASQKTVPAAQSKGQQEVFLTLRDVNKPAPDGTTQLHRAVLAGNLVSVEQLIKAGADVKAASRYGVTPLSLAASNGNTAIVGALLKAGADPNTVTGEGEFVLMTAARAGRGPVVQQLLEAGANPNARDGWLGQTALMWAAAEGHADVIQALAAKSADPGITGNVLEYHDLKPNNAGNVAAPLPKGGLVALHYAARAGALDGVKALASIPGIDLNQPDLDGLTPLHYATINANYDVAAYLLEKGADPNRADAFGRTILHALVDQNKPELDLVAVPETTGNVQAIDLIKLALAKGANPNAQTKTTVPSRCMYRCGKTLTAGSTPIRRAAHLSDLDAMRLLLQANADARVPSADGTNALMAAAGVVWNKEFSFATEADSIQAIEMLLAAGLDINAANSRGETALHGAARRGGDSVVKFLVERGADLTTKDRVGRTPLDVAMGATAGTDKETAGNYDNAEAHESTAKLLRELMAAKGLVAGK